MKKLSNIHKRLLGQGGKTTTPNPHRKPTGLMGVNTRPYTQQERMYTKADPKPGFYVACMGEDEVIRLKHDDAAVISIRSPGAQSFSFPDAVATLELRAEPHEDSSGSSTELVQQVTDFLTRNLPLVNKVHIHCTYGEIRSYSLMLGITQSINSYSRGSNNIRCYRYSDLRGFMGIDPGSAIPHQSLGYAGFRATRAAFKENEKLLDHIFPSMNSQQN